jgi:carboxyl-terminal processing protease
VSNNYNEPNWYENQLAHNQTPYGQTPPNDFDHYPFLPAQDSTQQQVDPNTTHKDTRHPRQRTLEKAVGVAALVIVAFFGGWFSHQYFGSSFITQSSQSRQYEQLFQEAWNKIDQNYVDRKAVNYQKMSYAAINAMVQSLGDTGHTRFMDPQTVQDENQQLSGKFTGIGIYLHQDPTTKKLIVTSPIPGSPAEKAGIKHNDQIISVNGKSVVGKDVNAVSALIQGKEGTTVNITIQRPGESQTRTLTITRAQIQVPNVLSYYIPEDHTVHIQVLQFADGVANQVKDQLTQAKSKGANKIILDLRDNPGGYLNEAINMTSLFVKSGNVLLQEDSSGNKTPMPVTGNPIDTTSKMVVLINGNSASAAEIVAGALKENNRATLIGQTTFGTGTVLQQFDLSDGSAILIGTQEWLTPQGHFIRKDSTHDGGIKPNHEVKQPANASDLSPNDESQNNMTLQQILNSGDVQLKAALEFLSQ